MTNIMYSAHNYRAAQAAAAAAANSVSSGPETSENHQRSDVENEEGREVVTEKNSKIEKKTKKKNKLKVSIRLRGRDRPASSPYLSYVNRIKEFSLAELALATNHFSLENRIGAGGFGSVYKGELQDGREVAIKRARRFQSTNAVAFQSELTSLSRLHHKHLVGLLGFCQCKEEMLFVYEYMKNGDLYHHLRPNNDEEGSSSSSSRLVDSWKIRIKILLDVARGIEYLHDYAVPSIIHRDIKSSNILLDSNLTAKVTDFGLSLNLSKDREAEFDVELVGTIGYLDPEYGMTNKVSKKTDIYGFGVVFLELLTGRRAMSLDHGSPCFLVDYAETTMMTYKDLVTALDARVRTPEKINEAEAVELVARTGLACVCKEGVNRPTIKQVVAILEKALALWEEEDDDYFPFLDTRVPREGRRRLK